MKTTPEYTDAVMNTLVPPAKKEQKSTAITLTSGDTTLQLVAERLPVGARTYALVIKPGKKNSRGCSATHESWEDALATNAVSAVRAAKLGWVRKSTPKGFTAAPDAFDSLPAVPKAPKVPKASK